MVSQCHPVGADYNNANLTDGMLSITVVYMLDRNDVSDMTDMTDRNDLNEETDMTEMTR